MEKEQKKGLFLAMFSVVNWGLLPVSAKGLVAVFDAYTLNFYRFIAAIIPLAFYLLSKNRKMLYRPLTKQSILILVVAVAGLLLNHIYFMNALKHIPAGTSQVIMQIGPLLLLLSGVIVFKEGFTPLQWGGAGLLLLGFIVFFNHRLFEIVELRNTYSKGVLMMVFAASIWVLYGLSQKLLNAVMSPAIVMLCCYVGGIFVLYPLADVGALLTIGAPQLILLLICAFSSLLAYIAFAESMNYWESSKSSAFLAIIPLISIVFEMVFAAIFPDYISFKRLSWVSLIGAVIVVCGTVVITVFGIKPREESD